jgi:hypothetical protein
MFETIEKLEKLKKKVVESIESTKAQGGLVGYFIGIMIAVIIALEVTWPVIDDVLNGSGKASIANLTGAAGTLVHLIPLFFVLTLIMAFIRPLM